MRVDKLKTGMKFKNYKDICNVLEMEIKRGNSRKAQIKDLERYCRLIKQGHSFTIAEVYKNPLEKLDMRGKNSVYGELLQLLITDFLIDKGNRTIITRNNFLSNINMINKNYTYCSENAYFLANYIDIDKYIVYDFFNTSGSNIRAAFDTALNNLKDKSLILYSIITMVCYKSSEHAEASQKDKDIIVKCQSDVLSEFNMIDMSHARRSPRWKDFRKRLMELLRERSDIKYYYEAYDITINQSCIEEKHDVLLKSTLDKMRRKEIRNELNELVCNRLIENAKKRREADSKNSNKKLEKARKGFSYVNDNERLVSILINSNAKDITNELAEYKNEEIRKWDEEFKFLNELN
ncbi:hypothetical protein [Siminovitchia fordii]|uniref:Uncharacterized protein n=1 Tax=Siminovitchia fordii TaxID=254759 RepID=A0ABQ4KA95_9BACI|nr:hypothetical protein [Siminovitchia fordii]GIN22636.1 hypothetical protein J1TS3_37700 [Siminovitchia fordii]